MALFKNPQFFCFVPDKKKKPTKNLREIYKILKQLVFNNEFEIQFIQKDMQPIDIITLNEIMAKSPGLTQASQEIIDRHVAGVEEPYEEDEEQGEDWELDAEGWKKK